jgi:hypothetical protein
VQSWMLRNICQHEEDNRNHDSRNIIKKQVEDLHGTLKPTELFAMLPLFFLGRPLERPVGVDAILID